MISLSRFYIEAAFFLQYLPPLGTHTLYSLQHLGYLLHLSKKVIILFIGVTMKAVICTKYGAPEVLVIKNVEKPQPKDNEILIAVKATTVNSGDVRIRGLVVEGFLRIIMRLVLGITKPRKPILGTIVAGIVEKVGKNVTSFSPGDEVCGSTGFSFGAYAEYAVIHEQSTIIHKPTTANFEESAAILFGGMTAHYFLHKAGISTKKNQKILIYGATGSVGIAAVEIAKYYDAHITAMCSEKGVDLVTQRGADAIVLYTQKDIQDLQGQYDCIFDAVGKITKKQCKHLLKQKGAFYTVGGLEVAKETKEQLLFLKKLYDMSYIRANIDKIFTFDDIVQAHHYVDTGRKKGNVVVKVSNEEVNITSKNVAEVEI